MSNVATQAELREIVVDLRSMAAIEPAKAVREALNRLADRYAALSDGKGTATPQTPALH